MSELRRTLQKRLEIPDEHLDAVNAILLDPGMTAITDVLDVIERYGTPEEINRQAEEARQLTSLLKQVEAIQPAYLKDLNWLVQQRDGSAFISVADYRRQVLGARADTTTFKDESAVTLEISALQYFPWVVDLAQRAIECGGLMPGRFIRVRKMREQELDGDLPAFAAAMQIIGASYAEQPDTRGSDGSNIHLGGPDTLIGYLGGVGQPNDYALKWLDEYLYYYTRYGVRQILNVNPGTIWLSFVLHRLGIDIESKISVIVGNDNPYSALWTLLTAKLFSRADGTTPLAGLNWSNSTSNRTIEIAAQYRRALGLEDKVRFEYHITQAWKGIVTQPFLRRSELVELADHVANISAKHEGGEPEVEPARQHPSDIQDYYRTKDDIIASGNWDALTLNLYDKFDSLNLTARALTEHGLSFIAARNLHR